MARTAGARAGSGAKRGRDIAAEALDAALALGEARGWRAVRLHDVAARLGVAPPAILEHYRDLDAVTDRWLRRGLEAMIAPKDADFATRPAHERIEACLLAWFDALAPHRRVTVEMLRGKMQPSHPHHWVPMIFNLSRTIHWLREAAQLPAVYGSRRAQTEEVGLTLLFLATLRVWAGDDTAGQARTRRFLRRRLAQADRLMAGLFGRRARPGGPAPAHPARTAKGNGAGP